MYQFKKGTAAVLAGVLSVSSVVPAFAAVPNDVENYDHITTAGNVGNAAVTLTVEDSEQPVIFSAYVPAELPIAIDANGDVTVPQNAKIINGVENLPIEVEAIDVTMEDDWTLASMDTDMSLEAKDTKKIAMELNGKDMANTDNALPWKIEANSDLQLNMKANLPDQSASTKNKIATIGFTMNWWKDDSQQISKPHATSEFSIEKIHNAISGLTGKITFETYPYEGEGGIDISTSGDGSVMVVIDGRDATIYGDGGSILPTVNNTSGPDHLFDEECNNMTSLDLHGLDTSYATCMFDMFNVTVDTLDVSTFDTSNVTNMSSMFEYTTISGDILDLTSFDTSQVTNMSYMFYNSHIKEIDLSSFDMSNVITTKCMFLNCNDTKTVYCRSESDAAIMKASSGCPSTINFVVKL